MILFIGNVMAVDGYSRKHNISPMHRRIVTTYSDLQGYDPAKLPEVICIGDWYKHKAGTELRRMAEQLGYKVKVVM